MKKNLEYAFFSVFGFLLSIPFFILPISNCDVGWHLSNGRYIVENFKIPNTDFISWLGNNREWINSEWLVHVIYYLIYKVNQYFSLYLFKFFNMILLCFGFFLLYAKRLKLSPFTFIWFIPSLYLSFALSLDLRPDNYSFFLFVVLIYFLETFIDKDFSFKNIFILLFIFITWANLHSGFIFGLLTIVIYAFSYLISDNINYFRRLTNEINIIRFKRYIVYFLFSLIGVLINPYGYKIFKVFLSHYFDMEKISDYIAEWQAPDIFINASTFYYFVFSFIVILLYLIKFLKDRDFRLSDILLLVSFTISSFLHLRLAGFGSIIVHIILARYFGKNINENKYFKYGIVFVFYYFYFWFEIYANLINSYSYFTRNIYYSNSFVSKAAIKFLNENWDVFSNRKMYNGWSSGGELGWNFYGKQRIFIDGRYIFLDILEEHLNAMISYSKWKNFYTKYNFDFAIYSIYGQKEIKITRLRYNNKIYIIGRPFYLESIDFDKWSIVFFDSVNLIIVRRDRFPKEFINKYEYRCILPYDFERMYLDIHVLNRNIDCFKKEMINYLRREIDNPNAFISFFISELDFIYRRRGR
ncbi:MAG: hypothetical protein N2Z20_04315 [Elusimicrobiales bacterium]|nr:hypothetical protein [Elusimicrobiales bacterium]